MSFWTLRTVHQTTASPPASVPTMATKQDLELEENDSKKSAMTASAKQKNTNNNSITEKKTKSHVIAMDEDKDSESDEDDGKPKPIIPILDEEELSGLLQKDFGYVVDLSLAATDDNVKEAKEAMTKEMFLNNQLKVLFAAIAAHFWTVRQIEEIIKDFSYYEMKNQTILHAFPRLIDKENFRQLLLVHVFSELERKVILEKLLHGSEALHP